MAQVGLQLQGRDGLRVHGSGEDRETRPVPLLFASYMAMSALRRSSSGRLQRCEDWAMPTLAGEKTSWLPIRTAGRERLDDALRRRDAGRHVRRILDQDRELVAADPGQRVMRTHAGAQALRPSPSAANPRPRWPRLSLTSLKRLRSRNSTVQLVPGRSAA